MPSAVDFMENQEAEHRLAPTLWELTPANGVRYSKVYITCGHLTLR